MAKEPPKSISKKMGRANQKTPRVGEKKRNLPALLVEAASQMEALPGMQEPAQPATATMKEKEK